MRSQEYQHLWELERGSHWYLHEGDLDSSFRTADNQVPRMTESGNTDKPFDATFRFLYK